MPDASYSIEFREGKGYAIALCSGAFSESVFLILVERVREHRLKYPDNKKYLVDIRGTDYHFDAFARFRIAEASAVYLRGLRISVLGNRGVVDKIFENAAVNRGLPLLLTFDEQEAVDWLNKA